MSETPVADIATTLDRACARAVEHHLAGENDLAEQLYRGVLQLQPRHPGAAYGFGMLRVQRGEPAAALPILRAVVEQNAGVVDYWLAYLDALLQAGEPGEALRVLEIGRGTGLAGAEVDALEARIRSALPAAAPPPEPMPATATVPAAQPDTPATLEAVLAHLATGDLDAVLALAARLCEQEPDNGQAWKILGSVQWVHRKDPASVTALRRACTLLPDDAEALHNLAQPLIADHAWREVEDCQRRILALTPDEVRSQHALAAALYEQQRLAEALPWALGASRQRPDHADNQLLLARIQAGLGRHAEAIASYRRAIALDPGNFHHGTELLFALSNFPEIGPEELFAEHCRFGAQLAAAVPPLSTPHANTRDPQRELRIGFVSADLRYHPVEVFIEPLLQRLSLLPGYRLYAYYTYPKTDAVSDRLRHYFGSWTDCFGMDDHTLAQRVREHGIDILIDVNGHTAYNRLPLFALKPAPVQLSWLGYAGTTGLPTMDYYLSDPGITPRGRFDELFSEKLLRIPALAPGFNETDLPDVNRLPALDRGDFTFGAFHRAGKLNAPTLALWVRTLEAVPHSRLLLGQIGTEAEREHIRTALGALGLAPERFDFLPRVGLNDFLRQHHQIDLCLDCLPYGGGTTTVRAASMGVPTVTLPGATLTSRLGASTMLHFGLPEFIVDDQDAFVRCAADWAHRPEDLARLRAGLRDRARARPNLNPDYITGYFDLAMRTIWRRWCEGLPPIALDLTPEGLAGGSAPEPGTRAG